MVYTEQTTAMFKGFLELFFTETFGPDGDFMELPAMNDLDRFAPPPGNRKVTPRRMQWPNNRLVQPVQEQLANAPKQSYSVDTNGVLQTVGTIKPLNLDDYLKEVPVSNAGEKRVQALIDLWNTDTIFQPSSDMENTEEFMAAIRVAGHTDRRLIGAFIDACVACVFKSYFTRQQQYIALLPGVLHQDMIHTKSFADTAAGIGGRFLASLVRALPSSDRRNLRNLYSFTEQREVTSGRGDKVFKDFYFERNGGTEETPIEVCVRGFGTLAVVPTYCSYIYGELKCATYENAAKLQAVAKDALAQAGEFTSEESAKVAMLFMKYGVRRKQSVATYSQYGKIAVFVTGQDQVPQVFEATPEVKQNKLAVRQMAFLPLVQSLTTVGRQCNVYNTKAFNDRQYFYVPKLNAMLPLTIQRTKETNIGTSVVFWCQVLDICTETGTGKNLRATIEVPAPKLEANEVGGMFYLENLSGSAQKKVDIMVGRPFMVIVFKNDATKRPLRSYRLEEGENAWTEESAEDRAWPELYKLFEMSQLRKAKAYKLDKYFRDDKKYLTGKLATPLDEIIKLVYKNAADLEQKWQQMWPSHLEEMRDGIPRSKALRPRIVYVKDGNKEVLWQTIRDSSAEKARLANQACFLNPLSKSRDLQCFTFPDPKYLNEGTPNGAGQIQKGEAYWTADGEEESFVPAKNEDLNFAENIAWNAKSGTLDLNYDDQTYAVIPVVNGQTLLATHADSSKTARKRAAPAKIDYAVGDRVTVFYPDYNKDYDATVIDVEAKTVRVKFDEDGQESDPIEKSSKFLKKK